MTGNPEVTRPARGQFLPPTEREQPGWNRRSLSRERML